MRVHRNKTHLSCYWCGATQPPFNLMDDIVMWNEVHSPYWAPAHRKCTDLCEAEAVKVLSKQYRDMPEGLEPETSFEPASRHTSGGPTGTR